MQQRGLLDETLVVWAGEFGLRAETNPFRVGDLHHTLLYALGLRADELFFEHNGRP